MRLTFVSLIMAGALGGCIASGSADVSYGGGVGVVTPDLVMVSPGVQVVADYDDSVFYSDGYYWRNDGGMWYRSTYYSGGWGYYASPPRAIISINEPYRYRNYRPNGYQPRHQPYRQPEPIRRGGAPEGGAVVRDHREPEPYRQPEPQRQPEPNVRDQREPEARQPEPQPQPNVRDHRTEAPAPAPAPKKDPHVRDHR